MKGIRRNLPAGKLIGYKKVYVFDGEKRIDFLENSQNSPCSYIVELEIPARAHARGTRGCWDPYVRKCRASEAKVVRITPINSALPAVTKASSNHDRKFVYEIGKTVKPKRGFNMKMNKECAGGIHFFLSYRQAVEY